MTKQKIFKFKFNSIKNDFDFYTNNTNKNAFKGITTLEYQNIYLNGPKLSGKSSLGKIWLQINNAIKYENNFDYIIKEKRNILIDDLNQNMNEENIFHIINHCKISNLKMLITSNFTVNEINFKLPDLSSRLKTFTFLKINQPDDDMLLQILTKFFLERQFIINSNEIFQFIIKNADRSYEDMVSIVSKLDTLSLEKKDN